MVTDSKIMKDSSQKLLEQMLDLFIHARFFYHQEIEHIKADLWSFYNNNSDFNKSFHKSTIYLEDMAKTALEKYEEFINSFFDCGINPFEYYVDGKSNFSLFGEIISLDLFKRIDNGYSLLDDYCKKIISKKDNYQNYHRKILLKEISLSKLLGYSIFYKVEHLKYSVPFFREHKKIKLEKYLFTEEELKNLLSTLRGHNDLVEECRNLQLSNFFIEAYSNYLKSDVTILSMSKNPIDKYSIVFSHLALEIIPGLEKMGLSDLISKIIEVTGDNYKDELINYIEKKDDLEKNNMMEEYSNLKKINKDELIIFIKEKILAEKRKVSDLSGIKSVVLPKSNLYLTHEFLFQRYLEYKKNNQYEYVCEYLNFIDSRMNFLKSFSMFNGLKYLYDVDSKNDSDFEILRKLSSIEDIKVRSELLNYSFSNYLTPLSFLSRFIDSSSKSNEEDTEFDFLKF